mmetsp:Transcript_13985/g.48739  ORF Transcript_13985/g.48739 Transcript_13985/m.48739 type:complete len:88 (+) Transcript_13985:219-482(+)
MVDFKGQLLAEQVYQAIIVAFSLAGFAVGFVAQSFLYTLYGVAAGVVLAAIATIPDYPVYNKNPVQWLDSVDAPGVAKPLKRPEEAK